MRELLRWLGITVDEAAQYLSVQPDTIRRWCRTSIPGPARRALERYHWREPEQFEYAGYVAYWLGVEHCRRLSGAATLAGNGLIKLGAVAGITGRRAANDDTPNTAREARARFAVYRAKHGRHTTEPASARYCAPRIRHTES